MISIWAVTASGPPPAEMDAVAPPEPDLVGSSDAGPAALRGSMLLGGSYAVTILVGLVSAPLLIRHLSIAGFGRYSTVVALVTVVNGLTDAGLVNITLREWTARRGAERRRMMQSLLGIRLELSAVGMVVGIGFAWVAGYERALVIGTFVAGVGMVLQAVANVLVVSLQGELRFGWVSAISVVRQVITTLLIVALVIGGSGVLPLLAVPLASGAVALVFTAFLVRGRMPLVPHLFDAGWIPLVRDTLPYSAAIALNTLYLRVTIVVMSLIATAVQTGYFATSFRITEVLIGVPTLAIGAAFPILTRSARDDRDRLAYATGRILELAALGGTGLALAVILSAPFVIDLLAGAKGAPAAPVLQIQALTLAATFLTVAGGFIFLSLRRHMLLLWVNVGALVINIALTLTLVPLEAARGAAIAAVLAESSLAAALLVKLAREPGLSVPVRALGVTLLAGLAGASPLLIPGLEPLLRTALGLLIYVGMIILLGRMPPELAHVLHHRNAANLGCPRH